MPTAVVTCNNLCDQLTGKLTLQVVCNDIILACDGVEISRVALPAPRVPVKITSAAGAVLPGPYYQDANGVITDINCNVYTPSATDTVDCVCAEDTRCFEVCTANGSNTYSRFSQGAAVNEGAAITSVFPPDNAPLTNLRWFPTSPWGTVASATWTQAAGMTQMESGGTPALAIAQGYILVPACYGSAQIRGKHDRKGRIGWWFGPTIGTATQIAETVLTSDALPSTYTPVQTVPGGGCRFFRSNMADAEGEIAMSFEWSLDGGATWTQIPGQFLAAAGCPTGGAVVFYTGSGEGPYTGSDGSTRTLAQLQALGGRPCVTPVTSSQYIQMAPVPLGATSQAGTLCDGSIATNLQLTAPTRLGPIPSGRAAFRDAAIFTPAATQNEQLHLVDTSQIAGVGTRSRACITFSQPVTNPVLHVGDIDRTLMDFAPYAAANGLTSLTRLSGSTNLQVNGLQVSSANPIPSGGVSFSNPVVPGTSGYGSIRLNGTFTQVCWDYVVVSDSVENHYLQVSTTCP